MKKFLSILFLFAYLLSATEFNQLLKTPLLVQHFIQHTEKNAKLSFIGFLKMHYFNGDPQDEDHEQDMSLPFKSHETCIHFVGLNTPFRGDSSYFLKLYPKEIKLSFLPDVNYSSRFLQNIWQPPKNS